MMMALQIDKIKKRIVSLKINFDNLVFILIRDTTDTNTFKDRFDFNGSLC